jgi:hypothetical protein
VTAARQTPVRIARSTTTPYPRAIPKMTPVRKAVATIKENKGFWIAVDTEC